MCEPVAIGLAVAGASAAAQGAAQSSAARKQNDFRAAQGKAGDEAYLKTVESVRNDIGLQTDALIAQRIQNIDAQKQQLNNYAIEARSAGSNYQARAAQAGVEGRSVDQVHQEFQTQVMGFESAAIRNITNYTAQLNREAQSIYSRGQNIINQGYPSPLPPMASVDFGLIAVNSAIAGLNAGMAANSAFSNPGAGTGGTAASFVGPPAP